MLFILMAQACFGKLVSRAKCYLHSADKVGVHGFLLHRGQNAGSGGGLFAAQVVHHVAGNIAQVLQALCIFAHVIRRKAMHHIPVAAGDNGHLRDGEVFLDLIQRGGGTGTAGRGHGCGGFVCKAVEVARDMDVKVCDVYSKWKELSKTQDTTLLLANRINHPTKEMHNLFADSLFEMIFDDAPDGGDKSTDTMYKES